MPIQSSPAESLELDPEEELLWSGSPPQGLRLRANDLALIPFSLLWGGFAIFWEVMVFQLPKGKAPMAVGMAFPLFGLPFVCVGLYLIFGRFFVDRAQRRKTFYAITNQRVIIRSGIFIRRVKSMDLRTLAGVTLEERPDGGGTLALGANINALSWFHNASWPGLARNAPPMLELPREARAVYNLLRQAQAKT